MPPPRAFDAASSLFGTTIDRMASDAPPLRYLRVLCTALRATVLSQLCDLLNRLNDEDQLEALLESYTRVTPAYEVILLRDVFIRGLLGAPGRGDVDPSRSFFRRANYEWSFCSV